jgi:hypothetical protein
VAVRLADSPRVEGLIVPEVQWRIEKVITLAQIVESTIVGDHLSYRAAILSPMPGIDTVNQTWWALGPIATQGYPALTCGRVSAIIAARGWGKWQRGW